LRVVYHRVPSSNLTDLTVKMRTIHELKGAFDVY